MSPILSSVTALSLLAHGLLGCCWHHRHACEEAGHQEVAPTGHCHADALAAACSGNHDWCQMPLPGHDDCHGARCVFVGSQRIVLVVMTSQVSGPTCTPVLLPVESAASRPAGGWPTPDVAAGLPPLRIHLLYQTLLI